MPLLFINELFQSPATPRLYVNSRRHVTIVLFLVSVLDAGRRAAEVFFFNNPFIQIIPFFIIPFGGEIVISNFSILICPDRKLGQVIKV